LPSQHPPVKISSNSGSYLTYTPWRLLKAYSGSP